jgi:hypothetical protein
VDPITARDDEIRAALGDAVLPPLLAALAHVMGVCPRSVTIYGSTPPAWRSPRAG